MAVPAQHKNRGDFRGIYEAVVLSQNETYLGLTENSDEY